MSCDYREAQSAVRDQGNRPTCAAFAFTSAHEWLLGHGGRSVECGWSLAKAIDGGQPGGTFVQNVSDGVLLEGQSPEDSWPYGQPAWPVPEPNESAVHPERFQHSNFSKCHNTFEAVAEQLHLGVPIILTLRVVSDAWSRAGVDGLIDATGSEPAPGAHAVLAVGQVQPPSANIPSLIIKNSWGKGWGDSGYGYVTNRYVDAFLQEANTIFGPCQAAA